MATHHGDNLTETIEVADTATLCFPIDGRVRCIMGDLRGIQGVVTATRTGGRVLTWVATGVYLELPRICVQRIDVAAE